MTAVSLERPALRQLGQFLETPKGIVLVILVAFAALGAAREGATQTLPLLIAAVAVAGVTDIAFAVLERGELIFPSGAILTGLIIALVLSPLEPWSLAIVASVIAIFAKHLLRTKWSNVFNPAACGLFFCALIFSAAESWWGALPDLGLPGLALLVATGVFVADRLNKLPLVAVFIGAYFLCFTSATFVAAPASVAEIFRAPDLQAVLFFAFFMLDDPPGCPVRYEDQIAFGVLVAFVSYVVFVTTSAVLSLPAGLLAGNAWESCRRYYWQNRRVSSE